MSADQQCVFAWVVRGLGGIVNMLEREQREGMMITPVWLDLLRRERDRITAVINALSGGGDSGETQQ